MAFKILTALLVACIAQNVAFAASLPVDKPIFDTFSLSTTSEAGVKPFGNPFACMPHLMSLWNAVQEVKTLFGEFSQIRKHNHELKAACTKLPTDEQVEECLKKADDATHNEMNGLVTKVKQFVPTAFELVQNFRKCLFE